MNTPPLTNQAAYNAHVAENAVRYAAGIFMGTGKYDTVEATTMEELQEKAAELLLKHPTLKEDRLTLYAYDADGNQTVIGGKAYKTQADRKAAGKARNHQGKRPKLNADERAAMLAMHPDIDKEEAEALAAAKPAKAPKAPKAAKAPKAEKPAKEPKVKGPSKWDNARELLTRKGGATKAELFAALKWRSMSLPLLKQQTGLTEIEKTADGWAGK